jgi:hypothetical protein
MAYDAAVLLHHPVKFGYKVGIIPVLVEHKVLGASWPIHIPKGFAGEVFHLTVIAGLF